MKKKGFTLIELLAVIVILAIIAIISVPIITDLINKSRYGAFGVTKKNIERAAELYHAKNADDLVWEDNISYVTIGTLKTKKFLKNNLINTLDSTSINDDTKVLLYRKGRKVDYSLQLYDKQFFDWYQKEMVRASKSEDITLPTTLGDKVTIDLETLMSKGLVDELRLPLEPENRCVGYVEIEKTTDNYEYNAYVDCLQGASTFTSHYVSYGGKYIDEFFDVKETSDGGYIAVGRSNSEAITKYETGNNGKYDAIIVKFKSDGIVEWSRNFGGSNAEEFNGVIVTNNGYIAVGATSSSDGDLVGIYKGGTNDAIIVEYDKSGNLINKRSYGSSGTSGSETFIDIEKTTDGYVVVGSVDNIATDGDLEDNNYVGGGDLCIIIKFDLNLNVIWKTYFGGSSYEKFYALSKTSDDGYIVVGNGSSSTLDLAGLHKGSTDAYIAKFDSNGNLQNRQTFGGSDTDVLSDVVEVTDGYVFVGSSSSSNTDMTGLNKTNNKMMDAVIVKYDKNLENIIWKKSFGGTLDDNFRGILKLNNNEFLVVGDSKSSDMDMQDIAISSGGYKNAIMIKYDNNGNILTKKIFGGNNSDSFNSIIKTTDNNYVLSGRTFSNDINLKNFNKGHSDAILVSYDSNLNLIKQFQEPVVIINKLKDIVANYGDSIKLSYNNIFTSNNPEVDLKNWCNSQKEYGIGYNYAYGQCLYPFNTDDIKMLTNIEATSSEKLKRVYQGEREYPLDIQADGIRNWHRIHFRLINTGVIQISNFKLKFADGYVGSIEDAVSNKYIEPLVAVSNTITRPPYSDNMFPNPINIIYTNGNPGPSSYPDMFVYIKPKSSRLTGIIFTSSHEISSSVGFSIEELRNFDMSVTPTE